MNTTKAAHHSIWMGALALGLAAQPVAAQTAPSVTLASESPVAGTMLEPLAQLGHDLADRGVYIRLQYIDALAAIASGGERSIQDNSGVVMFGADFDLNRIASIPGALFHLSFAQLYGRDLASEGIGSRTKVQNYSYPHEQFELTAFAWEQSLLNNRLNILVGRTAATAEFARSTYACAFNNAVDCPMEMTQLVAGMPGFPYVNWGGRVRAEVLEHVYLKAGAYMIDPVRQYQTGFDWGVQQGTGAVVPIEASYETDFASDPMPRHYKIGGWYNSAAYNDPYYNTKHQNRGQFGGTPLSRVGGRTGGYVLADQYVWKPSADSHRGISIFAAASQPFDPNELFSGQLVAGLIWKGPFAERPDDRLGFETAVMQLGRKEAAYLNGVIAKNHGHGTVNRSEVLTEIHYSIQLAPGIALQPAIDFMQHPDDINIPKSKGPTPNVWVFGAKFTVNMGQILGLPELMSMR